MSELILFTLSVLLVFFTIAFIFYRRKNSAKFAAMLSARLVSWLGVLITFVGVLFFAALLSDLGGSALDSVRTMQNEPTTITSSTAMAGVAIGISGLFLATAGVAAAVMAVFLIAAITLTICIKRHRNGVTQKGG